MAAALTERALSQALKDLMIQKPLNQIHVQEITDRCGLSRHTFYNYFHDVYELLEWTYDQEVIQGLENLQHTSDWRQALSLILHYTYDNKAICLNTFHSVGRDYLERFLTRVFSDAVGSVIRELSHSIPIREEDRKLCQTFYTDALLGVFVSWLKSGLEAPPEKMEKELDRLLDGLIQFTMQKMQ